MKRSNKRANNRLHILSGLFIASVMVLPHITESNSDRTELTKSFIEISPRVIIKRVVAGRLQVKKMTQDKVINMIFSMAAKYQFDPLLILAVIEHESRFDTYAVGDVGERGLMQVRPETAEWLSRKLNLQFKGALSLHNPVENIRIGAAYLDYLRQDYKRMPHYLAAYNMGPNNLRRQINKGREPQRYYQNVFKIYSSYQPNASAMALLDVVGELQHL